ncbi:MAG: hypothetical protein WC786_06595 [Patescibacteria group bacterium]
MRTCQWESPDPQALEAVDVALEHLKGGPKSTKWLEDFRDDIFRGDISYIGLNLTDGKVDSVWLGKFILQLEELDKAIPAPAVTGPGLIMDL